MKRIQLFEFEDLPWFPNVLRRCMTSYIRSLHRMLGAADLIAPLVQRGLERSHHRVVDLCSGTGGPMVDVVRAVRSNKFSDCRLVLTDLYPQPMGTQSQLVHWLDYDARPIDAGQVPEDLHGVRTMICSFHHMPPESAASILRDAYTSQQPFLAFEISDNSPPLWLWWTAIPVGFCLSLILTFRVRPLTFQQIFWTYIIPVLPFLLAWDGAVSNARTYTKEDLEELIAEFPTDQYEWEINTLKPRGLPIPMLYILGLPKPHAGSPGP